MLQNSATRYDAFPDAFDIEVALKSASFWPEGNDNSPGVLFAREQAAIGADSAREEFERATGRTPFLSTYDEAQTLEFDIPARQFASHGVLQLKMDLLRLDGVTINGTAIPLTGGRVLKKPDNAPIKREPYTFLAFPNHRDRFYRGADEYIHIEVTGRIGFCTRVPADAWQAVQQGGALAALLVIENLQSIATLSVDSFSKSLDVVGTNQQKDVVNLWRKNWPETVKRYARMVV